MSINIKNTLQGLARMKGMNLGELNEKANKLKEEKELKTSTQQAFGKKCINGTMRLWEFELYLDIIGYELKIVEKDI